MKFKKTAIGFSFFIGFPFLSFYGMTEYFFPELKHDKK